MPPVYPTPDQMNSMFEFDCAVCGGSPAYMGMGLLPMRPCCDECFRKCVHLPYIYAGHSKTFDVKAEGGDVPIPNPDVALPRGPLTFGGQVESVRLWSHSWCQRRAALTTDFPLPEEERFRMFAKSEATLTDGEWPMQLSWMTRLHCLEFGDRFDDEGPPPRPGEHPELTYVNRAIQVGCAVPQRVGRGILWLLGIVVAAGDLRYRYDHAIIHCTAGALLDQAEAERSGRQLASWFRTRMLDQKGGRKRGSTGPTTFTASQLHLIPDTVRAMLWDERMERQEVTPGGVANRLGISLRTIERHTGGRTGRRTVRQTVAAELEQTDK